MGLFDSLFGRRPKRKETGGIFETLTAYRPAFTSWSGQLYESELVRSAINARANHISKLMIDISGTAQPKLRTMLKAAPNDWQTWGQFLYRLSTILDMQNTAFIVPVLDGEEITGVFPVLPSRCEVVDVDGVAYLKYRFRTGSEAAIEMDYCGIMTKFQYSDDFFGETNEALRPTMELIDMNHQSISEGIKNSATFRFMAQVNNFTKPEDLAKERSRFNRENLQGESGGLLLFPNTYANIQQVNSTPFVVDPTQMEQITKNVYNYFGVNEDILQCKAVGDTLDGFFDGAIEPFSIQLSDVLTRMLFTQREMATGNRVHVMANRLQYMSTANKVSMARELGDRGVLLIDEIRDLFNLAPLPDGAGQHAPIRGEYYMVDEGKGDKNADDQSTVVPSNGSHGGETGI